MKLYSVDDYWRDYKMMFGNKAPDLSWVATELTAIRSGVDSLSKSVATIHERVSGIKDDMVQFKERLATCEREVLSIKTSNITKESSWLGFWKIAALLPVLVAILSIVQYTINLELIRFK